MRDGLLGLSNLMDLPGSSVRDVLAGRNPFDQYLDSLGYHGGNRVSGLALLQQHGLLGPGNSFWHHAAGIGAEMLADPLTAVFAGGKLAHLSGLLPRAVGVLPSPVMKAVSPVARYLPQRTPNQLGALVAHNLIARADPIMYAMDRDAQAG